MIRNIYWKIRLYFTDNSKYLEKFRKTDSIDDLKQYIIKSSNIDGDIEEIVKWNRCYGYTVNNEHYHCHTFKQLLLEIIFLYEEGGFKKLLSFTIFEFRFFFKIFKFEFACLIFNFINLYLN